MSRFTARPLPDYLREEKERIEAKAAELGLDFFPTIFEVLSYDEMNEVAAYGGFPTRYPHWRFGMEYEQLSKSHAYGLSKIYEMVINNNPSIAYLLEGNSMVDQKLVMTHVYAHVDFFKNNFAFSATDQGRNRRNDQPIRKWVDAMANHGSVIRRWARRVGIDKVESFIDQCLSLENMLDPQLPFRPKKTKPNLEDESSPEGPSLLRVEKDYMEGFINPEEFVAEQRRKAEEEGAEEQTIPQSPARDVMGFLIEHAPLEKWERDILAIIRREAYYFLPQMQTKIMNEGWATYWHSKLMTEHICDASEIVDYADRCAGVLATASGKLNPYKLGVELYRHIEDRWNKGRFGKEWESCDELEARRAWDRRTGLGREKIFEVRALYNDVTFIDEFLTPEFVVDQKLYAFGYSKRNSRFEIETRQFKEVKDKLLFQLTNAGNPVIEVIDANHENRGELVLQHSHQGIDLRLDWAKEVLESLHRVWKRPVGLQTILKEKATLLRYDGEKHEQKLVSS